MIFLSLFSKWFGIYYANFNSGFNRKLAKDDWLSREYKGLSYWRVTSIWRWDQWVLYNTTLLANPCYQLSKPIIQIQKVNVNHIYLNWTDLGYEPLCYVTAISRTKKGFT